MTQDYTYEVSIHGAEALKDARKIRQQVVQELGQAEKQLARTIEGTHEAISSQTRRLSYNKARLQEVEQYVWALSDAWKSATESMEQDGKGLFTGLVTEAAAAYEALVGGSIIPELRDKVLQIYGQMSAAAASVFTELPLGAERAAKQVEGVLDKAGRLRFPAGAQLEGVSLGGRTATQEQIDLYNAGANLEQIYGKLGHTVSATGQIMTEQEAIAAASTDAWDKMTESLNEATLKYFGIRRLGYGLEAFGRQMKQAGQAGLAAFEGWLGMYKEFNEESTRAAAAMEMNAEQQRMLEETVLRNTDAMRLFSPEETLDGLRAWAAGTGAVVETQAELNELLNSSIEIQKLARLAGEDQEQIITYVGGALAEYGLAMDDVNRVTAVLNYTAAKTFAEVSDVGQAFKLVGPLAHTYGISLEESAAALGLLSDENIRGSMAGRAFRQMLIQLSKPTKDHNDAMNRALGLNEELGQSWRDIVFPSGEFIGLASYIDILAAATENMNQEQRTALLATIATANELPALVSLVNLQTEARKEGINVLQAWTKMMMGTVDDEVLALERMLEETRGITINATTDMYSLWQEQSSLFFDSEAAKINEYEQRARALQIDLGRVVFDVGEPAIEKGIELLEDLAQFAADHPQLVGAAITGAAANVILGNLIQITGMLTGVVANYLIFKGAMEGFGISTTRFGAAVALFARSVGIEAGGDVAGTAAKTGILGALAAVLGKLAISIGAGVAGGEVVSQATTGKTLKDLFRTEEEGEAARLAAEAEVVGMSADEVAEGIHRMQAELQQLNEWAKPENLLIPTAEWGKIPEQFKALGVPSGKLIDEQIRILEERLDVFSQKRYGLMFRAELDTSELEKELFELEIGAIPLTEDEIEAVKLYDEMWDELEELQDDYYEERQKAIDKYHADEQKKLDAHHRALEKATLDHQRREASYYRDHIRKLTDIREDIADKIIDAEEDLEDKINDIRDDLSEAILKTEKDTREKIEDEEREHQKKMQRMAEDHRDNLWDLAINRDAYGIVREMRSYAKNRKRAQEDHKDRLNDLKKGGDDRIKELKAQAAKEEEQARKSHEKKLADLKKALEERLDEEKERYEEAKKERAIQLQEQLDQLKANYRQQAEDRRIAHEEKLEQMRQDFDEEYRQIESDQARELAMLLGMYQQGLTEYEGYLRDRLEALRQYLEDNRALWEDPAYQPDLPDSGGGDEIPGGYHPPWEHMASPVAVNQPKTNTIQSNLTVTLATNGPVPPQLQTDVRDLLREVFIDVREDLEVHYE